MRILVIGSGSIGKRHLRNLMALGYSADQLAAVDTRPDRRQEVEALGVKNTYASLDEALAAGPYYAAVVCSPTSMHIEQGIELAKRGTHMLMEKPLDRDLRNVEEFCKVVEENKVKVVMAYIFRSTPQIAKLRELLNSGIIGKPVYVRGEFSEYLPDWHPYEDYRSFYMARKDQGGGSILDQSHIMDLVHYLLGGFKTVYALNTLVSSLEIDADDIAEMVITLKSGVVASVHTDIFGRDHKKQLEIKGEKGNLSWDFYANQIRWYDGETKEVKVWGKWPADFNLNYITQTKNFLAYCKGEEAPLASLQEGIETMELILAAEKSQVSGKVENVG